MVPEKSDLKLGRNRFVLCVEIYYSITIAPEGVVCAASIQSLQGIHCKASQLGYTAPHIVRQGHPSREEAGMLAGLSQQHSGVVMVLGWFSVHSLAASMDALNVPAMGGYSLAVTRCDIAPCSILASKHTLCGKRS